MALTPDERRAAGHRKLLELAEFNSAVLLQEMAILVHDVRQFRARIKAFTPLEKTLIDLINRAADLPMRKPKR